jgi:uncharacterized membrane protein
MTPDELWQRAMELGAAAGCHQRPDRSFFLGDYQFPVCARCTGVFLGQTAALIMLLMRKRMPVGAALAMLAVMGADWGVQRIGLRESTNFRRLVTGVLGGAGIIFLYASAVRALWQRLKRK